MAKKQSRYVLGFVCTVCGSQNYVSEKSKINTPEALVLNKYCKVCRGVKEHKEKKDLD